MLVVQFVPIVGCSGSKRASATGNITLDGQAVEDGTISFIPVDQSAGPSAWGEIKEGRYLISAGRRPILGMNRVEIRARLKTGRKAPFDPLVPPEMLLDEVVEGAPARYNTMSELTADVKPGENTFDFSLQSK